MVFGREPVFVDPVEVPESMGYSVLGEICADKRSLSTSYQMIDPVAFHKRSSSNDGLNWP